MGVTQTKLYSKTSAFQKAEFKIKESRFTSGYFLTGDLTAINCNATYYIQFRRYSENSGV